MSPSDEERESLEVVRRANVLLPAVYAWAATVLYPVSMRGTGVWPRLSAALAVSFLAAGVAVGARRATLGRALGLQGFVAACGLTWILLGKTIAVDRLEPTKAALGAVGWVLFAFGWGASREPQRIPEDDPRALPGEALAPRGHLPGGAVAVLAIAIAGAAAPLALAWRVTRSSHALFAQAVSIGCAVSLVSSGARIAVHRGRWSGVEPASRRLSQAALPLTALVIVLLAGALELLTG